MGDVIDEDELAAFHRTVGRLRELPVDDPVRLRAEQVAASFARDGRLRRRRARGAETAAADADAMAATHDGLRHLGLVRVLAQTDVHGKGPLAARTERHTPQHRPPQRRVGRRVRVHGRVELGVVLLQDPHQHGGGDRGQLQGGLGGPAPVAARSRRPDPPPYPGGGVGVDQVQQEADGPLIRAAVTHGRLAA
ncbi:hypothetical protein ABZ307_23345 [Streptomyces griseorubiginosus]|uniref:hypothetical protein n=1 Tax=Streptomyces griseorubiginosus TaxID=67304 RepID=UPI0033A7503F